MPNKVIGASIPVSQIQDMRDCNLPQSDGMHGMKQAYLSLNETKICNDFITSCFYMKNAHKRQELTFSLHFSGLFSPFRLNSLAEDCEE